MEHRNVHFTVTLCRRRRAYKAEVFTGYVRPAYFAIEGSSHFRARVEAAKWCRARIDSQRDAGLR